MPVLYTNNDAMVEKIRKWCINASNLNKSNVMHSN